MSTGELSMRSSSKLNADTTECCPPQKTESGAIKNKVPHPVSEKTGYELKGRIEPLGGFDEVYIVCHSLCPQYITDSRPDLKDLTTPLSSSTTFSGSGELPLSDHKIADARETTNRVNTTSFISICEALENYHDHHMC